MQVRLKYAGIKADIVKNAADVLERTEAGDGKVYVIANYTALPPLRRELEAMQKEWED
ncbi:MAG: MurT ligase domain-containing protein [Slackia sp.]